MPEKPVDKLLEQLLLKKLLKKVEGRVEGRITGLSYHTETVEKGHLFFALPGTRSKGWEYALEAMKKGALAVVVGEDAPPLDIPTIRTGSVRLAFAIVSSYFYDYPSQKFRLAGITGTNGKTTTAYMIETLMSMAGNVTGLLGTVEYKIGLKKMKATSTTPESVDLQRMFSEMLGEGVGYVVMEVSSHALEWHRVTGSNFDVAVLTNITADHMDFHENFAAYRDAKTKLFTMLGEGCGSQGRDKVAVLNRDDPSYEYISSRVTAQQLSYGIRKPADIMAENLLVDLKGTQFRARTAAGNIDINLKLRGVFNVYNALAAFSVGLIEGLSLKQIKEGLEFIQVIPGRFEQVECGQDFLVIVDYAHTADGLENILLTATHLLEKGRIITVFGCGGERDTAKRPLMGEIAGRYSHFCIITSDNPRREDPDAIIQEIVPGLKKTKQDNQFVIQVDRFQAIEEAINMADNGDVVVIAGKGHEDYQILNDRTIPFSDRDVVREMLQKRYGGCP